MPSRPTSPRRCVVWRDAAYAAFVILVGFTPIASAQPTPANAESAPSRRAFSTLSVRLSGARNVNRELLHEFWSPRDGFELELSTPLPVGQMGISITALSFGGRVAEQPDFDARLLSLRWGGSRTIAGPVALRASALLGNIFMTFDDGERRISGLTTESELLVGGAGGVDLRVSPWLSFSLESSLQRILTSTPIDLVVVSAGAKLAMRMPRWLRGAIE
jgi:hypothetical protein